MMANPNMKFKNMCDSFWSTYGRVTEEEVKDNTDRLTTAWQPYQGFEVPVAQIKMYLVYIHFAKKVIPNRDLVKTFLILTEPTSGEQTTGLGGYTVLVEEGVPPSETHNVSMRGRI